MTYHKRKKPLRMRPEIMIMLMIFVCVSYQMYFTAGRNINGSIMMINDTDFIISGDKYTKEEYDEVARISHEIKDMCYFEIMDNDLNSIFKSSVINNKHDYSLIGENEQLVSEYSKHIEGTMDLKVSDDQCKVYYTWTDKHLVVYATSSSIRFNVIMSNVISLTTICLCFTMMIVTIYWQLRGVCNRYKRACNEVSSKINE